MNVRLLTDEDLRGAIARGLHRHHPTIDVTTVRAAGLTGAPDARVLEWAADEGRVVVTQDVRTMTAEARRRLAQGRGLAGVVVAPDWYPVGRVIDDLAALAARALAEPLTGRIVFLPLDKSWRVSEAPPVWVVAVPA